MGREIAGSTVVITGASSGIGRATAHAFAERGANVVLAARRQQALEDAAAECEERGVASLAVPTDVRQEAAVEALAAAAVERFGRIDTWFNNAGVYALGRIDELPADVFDAAVATDLIGVANGSRAAVRVFRRQGSGVLVNNASLFATVGAPYLTPYVAAKWGVRGLSEALRMELVDLDDVHVCTLMPASTDTPLFRHAANYTGRELRVAPPVYDARTVADAVVALARHPRRELAVGSVGTGTRVQRRLAPGATEAAFARYVDRLHFGDASAPPTAGAVVAPVAAHTGVSGGWGVEGSRDGAGAGRKLPRGVLAAAAALPLVAAGGLLARRRGD